MSDDYSFVTFEPLVSQAFTFSREGTAVELTLSRAERIGSSPDGRVSGVLTFVGPHDPVLPQATYDVSHPDLGEMPVFVVPVGQDTTTTTYEAVFG